MSLTEDRIREIEAQTNEVNFLVTFGKPMALALCGLALRTAQAERDRQELWSAFHGLSNDHQALEVRVPAAEACAEQAERERDAAICRASDQEDRAEKAERDRDEAREAGYEEAYQEGYDEGKSEWTGVKAQLWNAIANWLELRHGAQPDGDGYTVNDLLDGLAEVEAENKLTYALVAESFARAESAEARLAVVENERDLLDANMRQMAHQLADEHRRGEAQAALIAEARKFATEVVTAITEDKTLGGYDARWIAREARATLSKLGESTK